MFSLITEKSLFLVILRKKPLVQIWEGVTHQTECKEQESDILEAVPIFACHFIVLSMHLHDLYPNLILT